MTDKALSDRLTRLAIWLLASAVAVFVATGYETATLVDGKYIPAGNDSFYHARRILDAAVGERGFYQFDTMIHVPEGSWVNWPWAYDGLLAAALSLVMKLWPDTEPMAFLAYVPVAWLFVNCGLLLLVCRRAGLETGLSAVVLLAFALLPLTQSLHGVGVIDHHFIELTFVLAAAWAGLRFFDGNRHPADALILGAVLGIAPGFHNGLFVLQLPVLVSVLTGWLRGNGPPVADARRLAAALVTCTALVALPSEPIYDLQFEFWTLSWFHIYVAICTSVCIVFTAYRPYSPNSIALLGGIAAALGIPVLARVLLGTAFLSGDLVLLEHVVEVRSPLARLAEPGGLTWISSYYSWLLLLVPVVGVYFARQWWPGAGSARGYLATMALFGLALLMTQLRLHPFGFWAVLLGGALLVQALVARTKLSALAGVAVALLAVAVALQPALANRLFQRPPPGLTRDYAMVRSLFPALAGACERHFGAVLSYNDDGHYIRYHTNCSVLTNNFLMTPLHRQKIEEADRLLQMSPQQFLDSASNVDYLFVRMYGIYEAGPEGVRATPIESIRAQNAPLFAALTFAGDRPPQFELLDELRVDDDRNFAYASIFRIHHDD